MDTGDIVTIPIKRDELTKQTTIWTGTAWDGYGGRHLGIKNPAWKRLENGLIDIDGNYQGWGFGHIEYAPEAAAKGYSWSGQRIDKTTFEIAVTADELLPVEQRTLLNLTAK